MSTDYLISRVSTIWIRYFVLKRGFSNRTLVIEFKMLKCFIYMLSPRMILSLQIAHTLEFIQYRV